MTEVAATKRFFDFATVGTFGKAWEYGQKIYAQGHYGEEEIKMDLGDGAPLSRWGVYQRRHREGKVIYIREKFYIPSDPETAGQLARREVFRQGMTAWGNLTPAEKLEYNQNAMKYKIHGVNLFLRNWLKSN